MLAGLATCAALLAFAAAPAQGAPAATPSVGCPTVTDNEHLVAETARPGSIGLRFFRAGSARVIFFECVHGMPVRLGARRSPPGTPIDSATPLHFDDAATWSCTRRTRDFFAYAVMPDGSLPIGTYSVRTPSCAHRFDVRVARRVAAGATARIRIVDTWALGGIRPTLCITPPEGQRRCRLVVLESAKTVATPRLRATRRGRWRIDLRVRGHSQPATLTVGGDGATVAPRARPGLLATGDSTMGGVDGFLDDALGEQFDLRSDVRLGSALSRTSFWPYHAISQVRSWRPTVTVMSVGAAFDGSPMMSAAGTVVACCGPDWIAAYAGRVRSMMRTYLRGGEGRVFWLTVPMPRNATGIPMVTAINQAIVFAGAGIAGVAVIRVDQIFSPHGFQQTIRYRGRAVDVREPDGIHLNASGTAITGDIVARAIRAQQTALKSVGKRTAG